MPYTLKTNQISVKDPETGEYSGVDILAEQTEQGLIAELQAEGTTQVNRINQAAVDVHAAVDQAESDAATIISSTQSSINTLEAQKNTIAQTVASMAELGTDTTLSTPGMAADAGAVGELRSVIDNSVTKDQMQKCELVNVPKSANLWNKDESQDGIAYIDGQILTGDYKYFRFPVEEGHTYYFYLNSEDENARWIAVYDANGDALSAYGVNGNRKSYTVEAGHGIAYIAPTFGSGANDRIMVLDGVDAAPTQYIPYHDAYNFYTATDDFLANTSALTTPKYRANYMQRALCNLLNPTYPNLPFADGGGFGAALNNINGEIANNEVYWTTDFIEVVPGETLYLFDRNLYVAHMCIVCTYDENKNFVSGSRNEARTAFTVPETAKYMRFSKPFSTSWTNYLPEHFTLCSTSNPAEFVAYDANLINKYEFKPDLIPDASANVNLHVYLPSEICVGIGRTIELYNDLVCLEANKYHLHYSCSVGVQYARKFSIVGTTTGTYTLSLQIFNDEKQMVWYGTSNIKVVANSITNQLKIVPIGDSLTNLKPWLSEVQSLSDSKILYIGTRGRSDNPIRHEGRSGFSAEDYNANTEYTFDDNYQGASGTSGTVNPFWDTTNNKFSLAHYINTQGATVGTPDAVQLFLGTNDVFGGASAEESAGYITDLIDAIRAEYPNMPVFVCNTIYRSNQNGYYSSGGQGFTSASGWAFDSDLKIMELQNALKSAIAQKNYTNVFIVPLSVCMDRDYDFGQVEVAVNPRLQDVTVNIPSESVHPQNAGYMQIADVIYSSFIAHLN